jgi:cathepsin L
MKCAVAVALFVCAVSAVAGYTVTGTTNPELDHHWEDFKTLHRKQYDKQFEFVRRLIWESNLKYIQRHNLEYDMGHHTYSLGMNTFGDLTFEEFKAAYLGVKQPKRNTTNDVHFMSPLNVKDLPDTVDWRKQGYVTGVKDQGQCGSCWAFSTTGSLEGQYFRKTKQLESFSEQQLVDCSQAQGNQGCNGGLMDQAFDYIQQQGIERESVYPYTAQDGDCQYDASQVVTKVTGHTDIAVGDENQLKEAVATVGPVSVAIDASHLSFQFYRSGVYNEKACSPTELDHGVLAVGYGTLNKADYWLVKNSWGGSWGQAGYIYMSRNKKNQCGIATSASYPLL